MKAVGQIIFMIVLLISGIAYTVYNYLNGNTSQVMLIVSIGILGAALINMVQGLIRALRDRN